MTNAIRRRLICAATMMVAAVVAVYLRRSATDNRIVEDWSDLASVVVAAGLAGAWLLPRFVYPRKKLVIWPIFAGGFIAPLSLVIGLLPDAIGSIFRADIAPDEAVFWMILGALYVTFIAGPVFMVVALLLHLGLWLSNAIDAPDD